jgi:hypothetical protein
MTGTFRTHEQTVNRTSCPHCGALIDRATGIGVDLDGGAPPDPIYEPGDLTVCGWCGEFSVFTDHQGAMRPANEIELAAYALASPERWGLVTRLQEHFRARRKEKERRG